MKISVKTVLFIFCLLNVAFPQTTDKHTLDSLYNLFVNSHRPHTNMAERTESNGNKPSKCGTFLAHQIKQNYGNFTAEQQAVLKPMSDRPDLQTSIVSPAGHFRVHFDTTGVNVPAYDVNLFAMALDSSYNFEVNYLGFPAAPSDKGLGGDNLYDVYIIRMWGNDYGTTTEDEEVSPGSGTYISYIKLDNAFGSEYWTHGIDGARVTAAHEYHHAIQMGNYGFTNYFFMELTSTSMEDFVFDSINDYLNYTYAFFRNPSRCFAKFDYNGTDGYDLAIWHFFLKKKFGFGIIKREWEYTKDYPAVIAIDKALQEYGSSFLAAYNEFGLWCYFTGNRANPEKYFPDGALYPLIQPDLLVEFYSGSRSVDLSSYAAANNYLLFFNPSNQDTLLAVVTNGDVQTANASPLKQDKTCNYSLYNYKAANSKMINASYYYTKTPGNSNASLWYQGVILNGVIETGTDTVLYPNINYVFPSPFNYSINKCIYIPMNENDWGVCDMKVYSVSMQLVYNAKCNVTRDYNQKLIKWNGMDNAGKKLATGIYVYAIKSGNGTRTGKIVIINN